MKGNVETGIMSRHGFFEFTGVDPRTGDDTCYRISLARLDDIGRYHGRKILEFRTAVRFCESPVVAFEGIRHLDSSFGDTSRFIELPDPGAICLCGIASEHRLKEDVTVPPPPGMTFSVVASQSLEVWNWFWIPSDREKPVLPKGYNTRFDRQVWPAPKK